MQTKHAHIVDDFENAFTNEIHNIIVYDRDNIFKNLKIRNNNNKCL